MRIARTTALAVALVTVSALAAHAQMGGFTNSGGNAARGLTVAPTQDPQASFKQRLTQFALRAQIWTLDRVAPSPRKIAKRTAR